MPKYLNPLIQIVGGAGLAFAGLLLIGSVSIIFLEILLRTAFGTSTFIVDELVSHAVAGTTFFALPYALSQGGILRMSLVLDKVGAGARRVLDGLTLCFGLGVFAFIAKFAWLRVERSWERGSTSNSVVAFPLWIPEGLLLLAIILILLQLLFLSVGLLLGRPLLGDPETAMLEE